MTVYADWYSDRSDEYAKFRPTYPPELFAFLAEHAPGRELCWDAGTGSGQAAVALGDRFDRVVATDPSRAQLAHAPAHPRVEYRCEPAEQSTLPSRSVDLATAAASLHWFPLAPYFAEVSRVVRPSGLVAAWTYDMCPRVSPAVDRVLARCVDEVLGPYWPPEAALVRTGYRAIPWPFEEVAAPTFAIEVRWDLPSLIGVVETWSAAIRYRRATGRRAVDAVADALGAAWSADAPPEAPRSIHLPLSVRVGRVPNR